MTYIVERRVPDRKGNKKYTYYYECKSVREGDVVRQKVVRYIGKKENLTPEDKAKIRKHDKTRKTKGN